MKYKCQICCTDCERTHIFSNDERFIRCECGNVIINPKFQNKEKNLEKTKTDSQHFKEKIKLFFECIFFGPILYVICFWLIGGLFAITGVDVKSIRGWFFADNVDPLRCSFLESMCHPIFFILLLIGFTIIGFSEFVKNKKIQLFFVKIGGIFILILFLGGCINGCKVQSEFDNNKRREKQHENTSMIATHMTTYHPHITKIDLGRIRVSGWSGKIDCDYCDHLNKIKGNY